MRELAQHILDLVENSAAAGASRVQIVVEVRGDADLLTITVRDNGRGMPTETLAKATDPFFTSRSSRRVGLGIPLLKASAERSGGCLRIESQVGTGTLVEAVFALSNVDTPPLGDLKSTLICSIVGHQDMDVLFRQTVGDKVFELDSGLVKQALGDVPLTDPRALRWLERTVTEGLDRINDPSIVRR